MISLKKIFKLPSPKELGMNDYDALELRELTPDCIGPTWEDWHQKVKELHPIKYWIWEVALVWVREKIWWKAIAPFEKTYLWTIHHVVPSKRYHWLDLRQPDNADKIDAYKYGFRDPSERMLYAIFNLLGEYLKNRPNDLTKHYSREQIESDLGLKSQQDAIDEAKELYHWWTVERKLEIKNHDDLLLTWVNKQKENKEEAEVLFEKIREQEKFLENKTEEMTIRLMKIRHELWS